MLNVVKAINHVNAQRRVIWALGVFFLSCQPSENHRAVISSAIPTPSTSIDSPVSNQMRVILPQDTQWVSEPRDVPVCETFETCTRYQLEIWEASILPRIGQRRGGRFLQPFIDAEQTLYLNFQAPLFDGAWSVDREWHWMVSLVETLLANQPNLKRVILLESSRPDPSTGHLFLGRPFSHQSGLDIRRWRG